LSPPPALSKQDACVALSETTSQAKDTDLKEKWFFSDHEQNSSISQKGKRKTNSDMSLQVFLVLEPSKCRKGFT